MNTKSGREQIETPVGSNAPLTTRTRKPLPSPKQKTLRTLGFMIGIVTMTMLLLMGFQQPAATSMEQAMAAPAPGAESAMWLNSMSDYLFIIALPLVLAIFGSQIFLLKQISSRIGRKAR
jgi:hypothetical protein